MKISYSKIKDTLPNKISELLLDALEDLETALNDNSVKINMDNWLSNRDSFCTVCFAGATMLRLAPDFASPRSLPNKIFEPDEDIKKYLHPIDFTKSIEKKLNILDNARELRIENILHNYLSIRSIPKSLRKKALALQEYVDCSLIAYFDEDEEYLALSLSRSRNMEDLQLWKTYMYDLAMWFDSEGL